MGIWPIKRTRSIVNKIDNSRFSRSQMIKEMCNWAFKRIASQLVYRRLLLQQLFRRSVCAGERFRKLKLASDFLSTRSARWNDLRAYNLSHIILRRERTAHRTYTELWNSAHGKHMVIRRFDSSRLGFVNGTDVLRNLCDARRVSATGGEQASAHLDAISLNSMRTQLRISTCSHARVCRVLRNTYNHFSDCN